MKEGALERGIALTNAFDDNSRVVTVPAETPTDQVPTALGFILAALQTMRDGALSRLCGAPHKMRENRPFGSMRGEVKARN